MTGLHIPTPVLLPGLIALQVGIIIWAVTLQTIHLMGGGREDEAAPNVEWLASALMPLCLMAVAVAIFN